MHSLYISLLNVQNNTYVLKRKGIWIEKHLQCEKLLGKHQKAWKLQCEKLLGKHQKAWKQEMHNSNPLQRHNEYAQL